MRRQIPLGEIFDTAAFSLRASLYKVFPGIVRGVTPGKKGVSPMLVDVEVAVHDVRFDPELGARVSEPWPILPAVPVAQLQFAGRVLSFPMKPGDRVTLLSYDLDPTKHRATGNPEDPIDSRRHGGGYWLAWPVDVTDPGAVDDPGDFVVLGDPEGVQVQIGRASLSLGAANASDFAALASKVDAAVTAIVTAFNTHTHASAAPGSPTGPALPLVQPAPESTASSTVKVAP